MSLLYDKNVVSYITLNDTQSTIANLPTKRELVYNKYY
jgi:hypothetical protein